MRAAQDGGDLGQHAGPVHDVQPDKVARDHLVDRHHGAVALVRHERRHAVFFGASSPAPRPPGRSTGARGGVFAGAAAVEQRVADDVAAHEHGVEDMVHAGQHVRVRDQRRIHRDLNAGACAEAPRPPLAPRPSTFLMIPSSLIV